MRFSILKATILSLADFITGGLVRKGRGTGLPERGRNGGWALGSRGQRGGRGLARREWARGPP